MAIKKHIKNMTYITITASALVCGSVNAEITGYNGAVSNSFTGVDNYTFATIATPTTPVSGYYIGNNSAIATILDNAKRLNQDITIYIDNATGRITHVQ